MMNFLRFLGLAMVVSGTFGPGSGGGIVAAQGAGPCALLTTSEIQPLAPAKATISDGVSKAIAADGFSACRYTWGAGTGRFNLDVTVNDAARAFAGMGPDQIKQRMHGSVTAGTADAVVSDVGDAAFFKAESPVYVHATAYLKGRLLQVHLDGFEAREKKDQVIALLKSAASRL